MTQNVFPVDSLSKLDSESTFSLQNLDELVTNLSFNTTNERSYNLMEVIKESALAELSKNVVKASLLLFSGLPQQIGLL